jgi:hypothetical protein
MTASLIIVGCCLFICVFCFVLFWFGNQGESLRTLWDRLYISPRAILVSPPGRPAAVHALKHFPRLATTWRSRSHVFKMATAHVFICCPCSSSSCRWGCHTEVVEGGITTLGLTHTSVSPLSSWMVLASTGITRRNITSQLRRGDS